MTLPNRAPVPPVSGAVPLPPPAPNEPAWLTQLRTLNQPPPVFMFGGLKGGVAKSTSAWKFLQALAAAGFNPLGIDADPISQTLIDSYRTAIARGYAPPFGVTAWPQAAGMRDGVQRALTAGGHNALVFDTGGEAAGVFDAAAMLSDELIVSSSPTEPELRRLPATFDAARRVAEARNPDLKISVLIVKALRRSVALADAKTFLSGEGVPLLDTVIPATKPYSGTFGHIDGPDLYADVLAEIMTGRLFEAAAEEVSA